MALTNRLLDLLRAGKQTIGIWQMFPGAAVTRIISMTGLDWIVIDCEHGNISDDGMHECIHAVKAPCTPIVRIPDNLPHLIKRALDAGAHGLICPMVNTAAQAEAIVQASYFPPRGIRGFGSPFSMATYGDANSAPSLGGYFTGANEGVMLGVQIETREGVENVEAIAKVDGVHMLFVGPFDLSNSLGCPLIAGETDTLREAVLRVKKAAEAAGKFTGIYCTGEQDARRRAEEGWSFISLGSEVAVLQTGLASGLNVARGGHAKPTTGVKY